MAKTVQPLEIKQDGRGNDYVVLDNLRLTYVPASSRSESANWAGSDVIRIQAYRAGDTDALHMGAEIPIKNKDDGFRLIMAMSTLFLSRES